MPYRRLPNTDAARIRAMEKALVKGKELPPFNLAYTPKTFVRLQAFLPSFKHNYQLQRESYNKKVESNKEYQKLMKKAKTYINHFLRVMTMAVQRKDIRRDTPEFFSLTGEQSSLPLLSTENDIIYWGKKVMEGEAARIKAGRTPISNPTMAVVKVHYENFLEAYHFQKTLHKKTLAYSEIISDLRQQADRMIVELWNEVEDTFSDLPEEKKRSESENYGLTYVFRKSELHRIEGN